MVRSGIYAYRRTVDTLNTDILDSGLEVTQDMQTHILTKNWFDIGEQTLTMAALGAQEHLRKHTLKSLSQIIFMGK